MVKAKEASSIEANGGTEGVVYLNAAKEAYDNKDYAEATKYYLKAGEAGEAKAYFKLATLFSRGENVVKDVGKGFE
ncbi:hypothetical protein NHP190012_03360 [Helicobacter sp. NHP19-012]|uniref:Beta-lactamase n=1 Tax=Helicobacter gastrofelis TaxID=2849642 RepID=A0ABM7SD93_9HELI|nr:MULTISPECIES: hypothetical protein [unclassified Helicobacter]BCZ18694.1 hypothetical protein NHP190012_03360 [Helicobacter sp. NHP19-012]GMB96110.1 hypothetical protein NHP22001_06990 [Helicobacter sp. NHP22-001]